MKIAVICLNLTINAYIKWKKYDEFYSLNLYLICLIHSDKIQPPLNLLPTYINLANHVLGPEYVSIYVKYCYLDALVLLIQTFLEWTPGKNDSLDDHGIKICIFLKILINNNMN
jgi:hypothetical protein